MIGNILVLFSAFLIAAERSPDSVYDNTAFEEIGGETTKNQSSIEPESSYAPLESPQSPSKKVNPAAPAVKVEPADKSIPVTGGHDPVFTNTSKKDRNSPVFAKFQKVFKECSQNCDAAWAHTYGERGHTSCHTTGEALDLHGLICNGKTYGATSEVFNKLVACVRTKSVGGRKWKVLHKQSTGSCKGANTKNKATDCHWDHAHFSPGCWRNGRLKW
jgi:hypothetical protein